MGNLCKKHSFGYEPLKLLFGESCILCSREQVKHLKAEMRGQTEAYLLALDTIADDITDKKLLYFIKNAKQALKDEE